MRREGVRGGAERGSGGSLSKRMSFMSRLLKMAPLKPHCEKEQSTCEERGVGTRCEERRSEETV